MLEKKKIVLILSSGGARGLSHIGVIEELEKRNYCIEAIAGCSIGALIGGFYAAGKLQEFKKWILQLDKIDVVKYFDVTINTRGFIKGDKIFKELGKLLGDFQIEDLPVQYKAIAADIVNYHPVWFDKGSLLYAMRSSVSVPGVFLPVQVEGKMLVDGAVANPLPLNAFELKSNQKLFAVNLNARIPYVNLSVSSKEQREWEQLSKLFSQWKNKMKKMWRNGKFKLVNKPRLYGVLLNSFEMMQQAYAMEIIEHYKPDLLVQLSDKSADTFEFNKASELIAYGQKQASEVIDRYEKN